MRHPFQVSIVTSDGDIIIVAKRSTRDKANKQAADLRAAIGQYNRGGIPSVVVTDLQAVDTSVPAPSYDD